MNSNDPEKELKNLAELCIDNIVDSYTEGLAESIVKTIEEASKESEDFAKRKMVVYTKLIEILQKQVDESCGKIQVE